MSFFKFIREFFNRNESTVPPTDPRAPAKDAELKRKPAIDTSAPSRRVHAAQASTHTSANDDGGMGIILAASAMTGAFNAGNDPAPAPDPCSPSVDFGGGGFDGGSCGGFDIGGGAFVTSDAAADLRRHAGPAM